MTASELHELSSVNIDPHLFETGILWKVSGLNPPDPISTLELAEALARKLVEVFIDDSPELALNISDGTSLSG
jgi:hypothetical protein